MSWTLTVADLNEYVRRSLAGDPMLKDLRLRGEISNFKRHVSGHLYFSLKDEGGETKIVADSTLCTAHDDGGVISQYGVSREE